MNDELVGVISAAYESDDVTIRSNDLRNLRALADIIGIALSREGMQRERDEKKRLATEISIATKLQHQLLPIDKAPPTLPGYDLFIKSLSALEIAGDFVEVRQSSDGEFLGCVIDVMGKGVSAAILAGIFRSQFLAFSERGGSPSVSLTTRTRPSRPSSAMPPCSSPPSPFVCTQSQTSSTTWPQAIPLRSCLGTPAAPQINSSPKAHPSASLA